MTTMRETTRTFVAIPIPDPLGRQLARWQAALTPDIPGCRWVESAGQPFHITLAFLGDVPSRDLNEVCLAVAAAVEPSVRFELTVEGLGAFPSPARPRVLWAGITAVAPDPLMALREAVVRAATDSGYRPDDPRFHPHVTLGRITTNRWQSCDLTELIGRVQPRSIGSFPVVKVVTYASTLGPGGPTYAPLNRARLKGKKAGASH
jgi:2'-5' RNA ligase